MSKHQTLSQLVVAAIKKARRPLRNFEIQEFVAKKRPHTRAETLDTILYQASKAGVIGKLPLTGEVSKFAYTEPNFSSITEATYNVLTETRLDSQQIFELVLSERPDAKKASVDQALYNLSNRGQIKKSKTPMTDANANSQSKFVYSI